MLKQIHIVRGLSLLIFLLQAWSLNAAVITVNSLGDTGTATDQCELRSAIQASLDNEVVDACEAGDGGDDTIQFAVTGAITLTSNLPNINLPLDIQGPGKDLLIINGDGQYRPFFFGSSFQHRVSGLTIGNTSSEFQGGCIGSNVDLLVIEDVAFVECRSDFAGGAVQAQGNIEIRRSSFVENESLESGGALVTFGVALIVDSTFSRNISGNSGGAIATGANGDLVIRRSTFNGNRATRNGGAIYMTAETRVFSSTIIGNIADPTGAFSSNGGGIATSLERILFLENTIVAGNFDGGDNTPAPNIAKGNLNTITSGGFNFIGDNTNVESEFPAGAPNASNDFAGTSDAPIDPNLLPLLDFGGPTETMKPNADSPVIDQGRCPGEVADQRGLTNASTGLRPQFSSDSFPGDGCDIGSVEVIGDWIFEDSFESTSIPD